jgi:hypothetical protein
MSNGCSIHLIETKGASNGVFGFRPVRAKRTEEVEAIHLSDYLPCRSTAENTKAPKGASVTTTVRWGKGVWGKGFISPTSAPGRKQPPQTKNIIHPPKQSIAPVISDSISHQHQTSPKNSPFCWPTLDEKKPRLHGQFWVSGNSEGSSCPGSVEWVAPKLCEPGVSALACPPTMPKDRALKSVLTILFLSMTTLCACAQPSQPSERDQANRSAEQAVAQADTAAMGSATHSKTADHQEEVAVNNDATAHDDAAAEMIPASELVDRIMAFADGFRGAQDTSPEHYEANFKLRLAQDREVPTWLTGSGAVSEGWRYFVRLERRQDSPEFGYTGEISFPVEHWPGRMHEVKTCTIPIEQLVKRFREKGYQVDEIEGGAKFRGGWSASRSLPGGKTGLGIGIHESFVYDEAGTFIKTCVAVIVINHGPIDLRVVDRARSALCLRRYEKFQPAVWA